MAYSYSNRRGFALESAIIFLVLLLALVGAAVSANVMIQRSGATDYRGMRVQYAAEAGADNVMSQLQRYMDNGSITQAQLAAVVPPTLQGFTYSNVVATIVGGAASAPITVGPYTGLYGLNQRIDLNIEARDSQANRSNVVVSVNARSIPLFQFGVFYAGDLEINNGQALTFAGRVHSNGNIYISPPGNPTRYLDLITTAKSFFRRRKTNTVADGSSVGTAGAPDCADCVSMANAAGTLNVMSFDSQSDPTAASFTYDSNRLFDDRLQTSAYGITALKLPLPENVPAIAVIQPRNAGDTPAAQAVKLAWKANMVVTVNTTLMATPAAAATFCSSGGITPAMATVDCQNIFSLTADAFHDGREGIGVDLLQVDVGQLMSWMTLHHPSATIVYITFTNATTSSGIDSVNALAPHSPSATNDFPAVRLVNGGHLAYPFTVATDRPIYVQGSYNNQGTWQPASLMGDAITLLSQGWNDANAAWPSTLSPGDNNSYVAGGPFAGIPDTVYAAIAAGNSPTPCDPSLPPPSTGCVGAGAYWYGGGLENFPRLLENWNGTPIIYRGSLVALFSSQFAARHQWNWKSYYSAPSRDWAFDTNFRDPNKLPPGTPVVGTVSQVAFRPVY